MEEKEFVIDKDGNYHWYYELSMFKNPTLLITLYKVFGGVVIGCALGLGLIIGLSSGDWNSALGTMKGFGLTGIIILVLTTIAYLIYAAVQGGKYCVLFDMNEESVCHTHLAKQFKKAEIIAGLTILLGMAKGSVNMVSTGLLSGSRNCMYSQFKYVSKVKVRKRRNVIYLKQGLSWNHIYVPNEHFDEVLGYITSHLPSTIKQRGNKT